MKLPEVQFVMMVLLLIWIFSLDMIKDGRSVAINNR